MRAIAIERGHDGQQVREVGEEFDLPDHVKPYEGAWFEAVDKEPVAKPAKGAKGSDLV
jgi:hypothetical protein